MISVTELAGAIPNLVYRSASTYSEGRNWALYYRVAASYITGAHAFKVGFNNGSGSTRTSTYNFQPVSFTFRAGVPQSLTQYATPYSTTTNLDNDLGVYVQDRWTKSRLTLTLGVRCDYTNTSTPDRTLGAGPLVPNRVTTFPSVKGLSWHDLTPKTGASYDLVGNGRTALKFVMSKYLAGQLTGLAGNLNPVSTLVTTATRTWSDANRDYVADCNLTITSANGECLALNDPNFGTVVRGSTFDDGLTSGWGKRNYNWEFSTSVPQRLTPRMSLDVGYFRRWYGNFIATDNLAVSIADFNTFSIVAPVAYVIGTVTKIEWTNPHCFFYIDVKNEASGAIENWALELGNPNALLRAGWTPNSVKIGESVTVEGTRAKDGTFLGNARSMVLMRTGQRLFAGSSQTTNP